MLQKKLGIIATGAANIKEVELAVKEYLKINKSLVLMQCNHTGNLKNINYVNLNVLNKYKKKFPNVLLGLSDHTFGHTSVLGAVVLGARVIEKHFTDDNKRLGPDHFFAMNPKSWREMVLATRDLESAMGDGVKKIEKNELQSVIVQRRSIRANQSLKKGTIIKESMLDYLRPWPKGSLNPREKYKILHN